MLLSMRKILFNRPWLLVVGLFGSFVALWIACIVFAVKHQPPQVPMVKREVIQHGGD